MVPSLPLLALALAAGSPAAHAADYAAVLLRIEGTATLLPSQGAALPLSGYEGVVANERLVLGEASRVTLVFPQDLQVEVWSGPGTVSVYDSGGVAEQSPPRRDLREAVAEGQVQAAMDYESWFAREEVLRVGAGIVRGGPPDAATEALLSQARDQAQALYATLGPTDPTPLLMLGAARFKAQQPESALPCFEEAAQRCPTCAAAIAMRDHLRQTLGEGGAPGASRCL